MATYVFLDNYRGFSNAVIPLGKVNFLVGENSTGKSSFMTVVSFLIRFPIAFASRDCSRFLGTFGDCVTSYSSNKKSFTLAWFEINEVEHEYSLKCVSYLIKNKQGVPFVSGYAEKANNYEISISFNGRPKYAALRDETHYKTETEAKAAGLSFAQTCGLLATNKGFNYYSDEEMADRLPLSIVAHFVRRDFFKNEENKQDGNAPSFPETPYAVKVVSTIDPIRMAPRKYYDSDSLKGTVDDYSSYIELNRLTKSQTEDSKKLLSVIDEFGIKSRLFDSVATRSIGSKSLIAPFEVSVRQGQVNTSIKNVGYGVSQILPLLVECAEAEDGICYLLQQPEVHLHPRAQAAFGDFLYRCVSGTESIWFIETHSDYLIDRFRMAKGRNSASLLESQVLFFSRTDAGNRIDSIQIENNGRYSDSQPKEFREFFLSETFSLLEIL